MIITVLIVFGSRGSGVGERRGGVRKGGRGKVVARRMGRIW